MSSSIQSHHRSLVTFSADFDRASSAVLWAADTTPAPPVGKALAGWWRRTGTGQRSAKAFGYGPVHARQLQAAVTTPEPDASPVKTVPKEMVIRADRDYEIEPPLAACWKNTIIFSAPSMPKCRSAGSGNLHASSG